MSKIYEFFSGTNNKKGGVSKEEPSKVLSGGYFFKLLRRSFHKLTGLNLVFVLCNFPIFFVLYGLTGNLNETVDTPTSPLFAQLYGIMQYEQNPVTASLGGIFGISTDLQIVSTASRILLYSGFLLVITLGLSSVGLFYVLRNMVRGDYVSVWSDFFSAIKKNLKQGLMLGIIDAAIILFLVYDFAYYRQNAHIFFINVFYYAIIIFSIVYFIMRFHMYTILVTFDLPLRKIFKNAFLLTVLGLKRNLALLLSSILIALINIYIYIFLPTIGFLLVLIFTIALLSFLGAYCVYPAIKKYMIDPYYEEHPEEKPEEITTEKVFIDRE